MSHIPNEPDETGALPPCRFYVSVIRPECGLAATASVPVRTETIDARVDLCPDHFERYKSNRRAIAERNRKQAERRRASATR